VFSKCVMKLSPFRVSFDGPLPRSEQWRARFTAMALIGAALLVGSGGMSTLLNASSGVLAAWSNGKLGQDGSKLTQDDRAQDDRAQDGAQNRGKLVQKDVTTGVASPIEPVQTGSAVQPVMSTNVAAPVQAAKASPPPRDVRGAQSKTKAKSVRRVQAQKLRDDEWRRSRADARTEQRWNERAAEMWRRAPGNNAFGPFR
jgi:hypothetical protein